LSNFMQGYYQVKNTDKYSGKTAPYYRSSWELAVCRMCDNHPNILEWSSESIKIPYRHPLKGTMTVYVPDFVVLFEDKKKQRRLEVWEIKPSSQTFVESAKREKDKLALAVNAAKWQAAQQWCSRRGAIFKVINEDSIFANNRKK
jgi:hypothetical protein